MAGLDSPSLIQLPGHQAHYGSPNHIVVTADMTSATWNTVASHETFTVTGAVGMFLWNICNTTLTDAADLATIQYGVAGTTTAFIAATDCAGKAGSTIEAGEFWVDASPADTYGDYSTIVLVKTIAGGLDVGYEIAGEALTGGSMDFHCQWWPLDATGVVAAGAGGAL